MRGVSRRCESKPFDIATSLHILTSSLPEDVQCRGLKQGEVCRDPYEGVEDSSSQVTSLDPCGGCWRLRQSTTLGFSPISVRW